MDINNQLKLLKKLTLWEQKANLKVSKGSIGWHIAHTLKVIEEVIKIVEQSDPQSYKWKFNFNRIWILQ